MNTANQLPVIHSSDVVVIGGGVSQLTAAISLAEKNNTVVMAVKETYLLDDLCGTGLYNLPYPTNSEFGVNSAQTETCGEFYQRIFPAKVDADRPGCDGYRILHPDRLKRHAEDLCAANKIKFIYGTSYIGEKYTDGQKYAVMGGKFGFAAIKCARILTPDRKEYSADRYVVNLMHCTLREDTMRIAVEGNGTGQYAYLRKGGYSDEHAFLDIPVEVAGGSNAYDCRKQAITQIEFLRKNVEQLKTAIPGRFSARPYCSKYNLFEEIVIGLKAAAQPEMWAKETAELKFKDCKKSMDLQSNNLLYAYKHTPVMNCNSRLSSLFDAAQQFDVIVAGGGTAGVVAAIYAARQGLKTALVDMNGQCGGTGTIGGVNAYWFGKRFNETREIDRLVKQAHLKLGIDGLEGIWGECDRFNPDIKAAVLEQMCRDAGVDMLLDTCITGALVETSNGGDSRVCGIAAASSEGKNIAIYAGYVIDGTGDADIAAFAGARTTYGSDRDFITYWASLAQYTTPAEYKNNFSSMVAVNDPDDYTRFITAGRRRGVDTYDHGTYVAPRESRHIKGLYEISLKDILTYKNYRDTVYTCFSNYDPKGKISADIVYAGFLPPQNTVAVPLRALIPTDERGKKIDGILVAGKAISCTHNALPGMRMQPDLQHQGAVAALIVSQAIKKGRALTDLDIKSLQDQIRANTGDELCTTDSSTINRQEMMEALAAVNEEDRTHWVDLPFDEETREKSRMLILTTLPEDRVPPLDEMEQLDVMERLYNQFAHAHGEFKDTLAIVTLWNESIFENTPMNLRISAYLVNSIVNRLNEGEGLPERKGSTQCVQLLPDHGVMPETVYMLNALAWSKSRDIAKPFQLVLENLLTYPRDYHDNHRGIFHYVETFAYVAEHTGNLWFIPMLRQLLEMEELKNSLSGIENYADILNERLILLVLILNRALARLGDKTGYNGLIGLLDCGLAPIAASACKELRVLLDRDLKMDPAAWRREMEKLEFPRKMRLAGNKKIW